MIKLSKVRDALYDVSVETSCYFNTKKMKYYGILVSMKKILHIQKMMNLMMTL